MSIELPKTNKIPAEKPDILRFDMTNNLDAAETLTGVPTVSEANSKTGITFGSAQVNTEAYYNSDANRTVEIGKGVLISVTSADMGCYRCRVEVPTTSTVPGGRTIDVVGRLHAV